MGSLEVLVARGSLGTSSKTVETLTALWVELGVPYSLQQEELLTSCPPLQDCCQIVS